MKALVHRNRHGAAAAYLKPAEGALPRAAYVPMADALQARATTPVAARGPQASWEDHCKLLASRARNGEQHWTVEDVPNGISAAQALRFVRRRDLTAPFEEQKQVALRLR